MKTNSVTCQWWLRCSALTLIILCVFHRALADPPVLIIAPEEGIDSMRVLVRYLWPVLPSTQKMGRVYYRAVFCKRGSPYSSSSLAFPQLHEQPSAPVTELADLRSVFRSDRDFSVAKDKSGVVRVRIGAVPATVLHTRIPKLIFDPIGQYNLVTAIKEIEWAPEVRAVMRAHKVTINGGVDDHGVQLPMEGVPHMPAELSNVTMDEALDVVAKTWGVIIFFGACTKPNMYEVSFANGDF